MSQHSARGTAWQRTRLQVLERDQYTCVYCGNEATQVDHLVAKAKGGGDEPSNLVASCQPCNNRKSDKVMVRTSYYNKTWITHL